MKHQEAVSSVVAAVLIFSLFSTAMMVWTVQTLPEWVAAREDARQDIVQDRLGELRAGLERLSASDESGPVSISLPLAARAVPMLQRPQPPSAVGLEDGFSIDIGFTGAVLHERNGGLAGDPSSDIPLTPVVATTDAISLRALKLSLASASVTGNSQAWVKAQVTDQVGNWASVQVQHLGDTLSTACSGTEIRVLVDGPSGPSSHPLLCGAGNDSAKVVDVLGGDFGFRAGLGAMSGTFTLTLSRGDSGGAGASGKWGAIWINDDGRLQTSGGGLAAPGLAVQETGKRLTYVGENLEFPDQNVNLEGGAIIVDQADGMSITGDPAVVLRVDAAKSIGYLRWTATLLRGDSSLSGLGTASVAASHDSTQSLIVVSSGSTVTIESEHAPAWRQYFTNIARAADATTQATIGGTGDTATLTLGGGLAWTLELRFIRATVTIT